MAMLTLRAGGRIVRPTDRPIVVRPSNDKGTDGWEVNTSTIPSDRAANNTTDTAAEKGTVSPYQSPPGCTSHGSFPEYAPRPSATKSTTGR